MCILKPPHQRLVFMLWICRCSPAPTSAVALPTSSPYFQIVSPALMSLSATLWPIGMSIFAFRWNVVSFSVMTPSMSVPAFKSSTTTTPHVSFGLCTKRCGMITADDPPWSVSFTARSALRCLVARLGLGVHGIKAGQARAPVDLAHDPFFHPLLLGCGGD